MPHLRQLCLFVISTTIVSEFSTAQVQLIIDTDASFDVDNVVAICLAHSLADLGEVDILGIFHNA